MASRMSGSSDHSFQNARWLNQTSSPVCGWWIVAERSWLVRRLPSVCHSQEMPFSRQYASTSARSSVAKAVRQPRET